MCFHPAIADRLAFVFPLNLCEQHLIATLSELVVLEVDVMIPLRGVSYALQLLSPESKKDLVALKGSLSLMCQVIQQSDGSFQNLRSVKTHLQQISLYLMEHLVSRVWLSSLKEWSEVETVSAEVLASFSCSWRKGKQSLRQVVG